MGPIIVNATLVVAAAILAEAALSFLGFGVQPPIPALGKLIADGQSSGLQLWWLVTFPGLTIVAIALAVNFVGDGLRDALDPTQGGFVPEPLLRSATSQSSSRPTTVSSTLSTASATTSIPARRSASWASRDRGRA